MWESAQKERDIKHLQDAKIWMVLRCLCVCVWLTPRLKTVCVCEFLFAKGNDFYNRLVSEQFALLSCQSLNPVWAQPSFSFLGKVQSTEFGFNIAQYDHIRRERESMCVFVWTKHCSIPWMCRGQDDETHCKTSPDCVGEIMGCRPQTGVFS